MKTRSKRIALVGMLVGLAFVLSWLESMLPAAVIAPGVKLGLANIITVFAVYKLRVSEVLFISLARITLAGFAFSGLFASLYALCGALLSIAVMLILKKCDLFTAVGVSVCGGVSHNIGQILFAVIVSESRSLLYYLPVLAVSGVLSGALVGMLGGYAVKRIKTE